MNIDHLSYSTCKLILNSGIDYAVGVKLGLIEESYGRAAELGTLIHALVLEDRTDWVVSPYDTFRSKDAKAWKAVQTQEVVKPDEETCIVKTAEAIRRHPLAVELINACALEVEIEAKFKGLKFTGKADGMSADRTVIFDLKTTAQFDRFLTDRWYAIRQDYDLQAAVYTQFGIDPKYYFIVAETVAPYRVTVVSVDDEFVKNGKAKLDNAIAEFNTFRKRSGETDLDRLSFNIGEVDSLADVQELGDWS